MRLMLTPKTSITLMRSVATVTTVLLVITALHTHISLYMLRLGIMIGFFVLAIFSFLLGYRMYGIIGIALAVLFSPFVHLYI